MKTYEEDFKKIVHGFAEMHPEKVPILKDLRQRFDIKFDHEQMKKRWSKSNTESCPTQTT